MDQVATTNSVITLYPVSNQVRYRYGTGNKSVLVPVASRDTVANPDLHANRGPFVNTERFANHDPFGNQDLIAIRNRIRIFIWIQVIPSFNSGPIYLSFNSDI
jgi:hypothetical protein